MAPVPPSNHFSLDLKNLRFFFDPTGRWLAFQKKESENAAVVKLLDVQTGTIVGQFNTSPYYRAI